MTISEAKHLTTIGVIGDIHAESSLLQIALTFLRGLGLQTILCVGDIVDGAESVDVCCKLLQHYGVISVRGNRDRWFLTNEARQLPEATQLGQVDQHSVEFIASLPVTLDFKTLAGEVLLCHGIGTNDMGRLTPSDSGYALEANIELQDLIRSRRYRYMINGHTHRRLVRSFGSLTVINAGTLKHDHEPCFLTVDFELNRAQFFDILPNGSTITSRESCSL